MAEQLHLTTRNSDENEDDEDEQQDPPVTYPIEKPVRKLFDELESWVISSQRADDIHDKVPSIDQCQMVWGGKVIIGIGSKGALFQWKLQQG